jgi:hypothetical protein
MPSLPFLVRSMHTGTTESEFAKRRIVVTELEPGDILQQEDGKLIQVSFRAGSCLWVYGWPVRNEGETLKDIPKDTKFNTLTPEHAWAQWHKEQDEMAEKCGARWNMTKQASLEAQIRASLLLEVCGDLKRDIPQ